MATPMIVMSAPKREPKVSRTRVADTRKIVFSGFAGTNPPSFQTLVANFEWGLDNLIHGVHTVMIFN